MAESLLNGETVAPTTFSYLMETSYFGQRPTGAIAETFPRNGSVITATAPVTANATYTAINLVKGQVVTTLTFWVGATAAGTPTHALAGLADSSFNLLASSADLLTAAWAANSAVPVTMATPYTAPADGLYYVIVAIVATTVPTLAGLAASIPVLLASAPAIAFTDTAHTISTALPATGTKSAGTTPLYVTVS